MLRKEIQQFELRNGIGLLAWSTASQFEPCKNTPHDIIFRRFTV